MIAPTAIANDPRTHRDILACLENPDVDLRVPIICTLGVSDVDWKTASEAAAVVRYDKLTVDDLAWIRRQAT
jgi:hypothetical protein